MFPADVVRTPAPPPPTTEEIESLQKEAAAETPEQKAAIAEARMRALVDQPDTSGSNAATIVFGDTGTGKTHLLCTAAEYCWETYKKISRMYVGDLGGFGTKAQSLMRLGIIQPWRLRNHVEPFETAELASLGYWPETVDSITGYAAPNVRLLPPMFSRWTMICPNGHVVKTVTVRSQLTATQCPTCKTLTDQNNWAVDEQTFRSPGFKHVGLNLFESLTSWNDWIMEDMAKRAGRDELGGEKGAINKLVSGSMVFGSNNRAHYGFAQSRSQAWINNSLKIPGQVMPPIWTALMIRSQETGKAPVYGPKIAGQAKTEEVPSWVGNCLHASKEKNDKGLDVYRLWTTMHISPPEDGKIPYLCKHRSEPGALPPYLEDDEDQPPFTVFSLGYFFLSLQNVLQRSVARDANRFPDAPALMGGFADDDEELIAEHRLGTGEATPTRPGGVRPGVARPAAPRPAGAPASRPAVAPKAPAPATSAVVAGAPAAGSVAAPAAPPAPPPAGTSAKPAAAARPAARPPAAAGPKPGGPPRPPATTSGVTAAPSAAPAGSLKAAPPAQAHPPATHPPATHPPAGASSGAPRIAAAPVRPPAAAPPPGTRPGGPGGPRK